MIRFACPKCSRVMEAAENQVGKHVSCAGCGRGLRIPTTIGRDHLSSTVPRPKVPIAWIVVVVVASLRFWGFGVGWWFAKVSGVPAVAAPIGAAVPGDVIAAPEAAAVNGVAAATLDTEPLTWQQLQDHLAKLGVETKRLQGKMGMWFIVGSPNRVPVIEVEQCLSAGGGREFFNHFGQMFVVNDFGSANAARREAASIEDVRQRKSLAWRNFVFDATPDTLELLDKALR